MKKKLVIISIITISIIIGAVFLSRFHQTDYSGELSYITMNEGFSPYGIVRQLNEPYVLLCDFESSREVALCAKPQCTHDNLSCFACYLKQEDVQYINLYGGKLYYIRTLYDHLSENKYAAEVYCANIDGSGEQKIGRLEGFIFCHGVYIVDGMIFLHLEKYNSEYHDKVNREGNKDIIIHTFACIEISTGKTWVYPEKQGYGQSLLFAGYDSGIFYYTSMYNVEALRFDYKTDDWSVFIQECYEKSRITLWAFDTETKTEQAWDDMFFDKKRENMGDIYYFRCYDGNVYYTAYTEADTPLFSVMTFDAVTKRLKFSETFDCNSFGTYDPYMHGSLFVFNQYDDTGFIIEKRVIYDPINNITVSADKFNEYSTYARIGDKMVFYTPSEKGGISWISVEDFINNQGIVRDFVKGY